MKQVLTKYQFFMKLPQIPQTHKTYGTKLEHAKFSEKTERGGA